jgi:PUA domain protein
MDDVKKGTVVAIMAEGKEHAMGVGIASMSSDEIRKVNKGVGIDVIFHLNDGMWKLTRPQILL